MSAGACRGRGAKMDWTVKAIALCLGLLAVSGCGDVIRHSLVRQSFIEVSDQDDFEQDLLALINSKRAELELPALITTTVLMEVAEAHSRDMANRDYLGHADPEGLSAGSRLDKGGYRFIWWGEVIAGGSASPVIAIEGWLNSPEHKAILLDGKYQEIGLGFAYNDRTKYWNYWTVVVTRPAGE